MHNKHYRTIVLAALSIVMILLTVLLGSAYAAYAQTRNSQAGSKQLIKIPGGSRTIRSVTTDSHLSARREQITAVTDMTEGFENSWPASGWIVLDQSSIDGGEYLFGKRDCHPHTGSYGGWSVGGGAQGSALDCTADYPENVDTWAVYGPFDLTAATSASLTFYVWGESEYEAACSYDYLYLGSSTDGASFSNGGFYCGDATGGLAGNGYYQETFDLSDRLGESQVWIGFEFVTDDSLDYAGFTLDDLTLTVDTTSVTPTWTSTPTRTPTPTPTSPGTPSQAVYLPLIKKSEPSGPTLTPTVTPTPTPTRTPTPTPTSSTGIVPKDGSWTGPGISFGVSNGGTHIVSINLFVTDCQGLPQFYSFGATSISGAHFFDSQGGSTISGNFTSANTASGTYSVARIYPCTGLPQTGNWSASTP